MEKKKRMEVNTDIDNFMMQSYNELNELRELPPGQKRDRMAEELLIQISGRIMTERAHPNYTVIRHELQTLKKEAQTYLFIPPHARGKAGQGRESPQSRAFWEDLYNAKRIL